MSNKVNKYMKQYEERNYAPKARKVTKSDLQEYINRGESRKATEASCSDSAEQSRKEQEDQMIRDMLNSSASKLDEIPKQIGEEDEERREEDAGKAHRQRRQRVSLSDKRGCEAEESRPVKQTKRKSKA